MPKKQRTTGDRVAIDAAVGIVAWLLIVELMALLERHGVLKMKDAKRIFARALSSLELLEASTFHHPAFAVAREIIQNQIEGWNRDDLK